LDVNLRIVRDIPEFCCIHATRREAFFKPVITARQDYLHQKQGPALAPCLAK